MLYNKIALVIPFLAWSLCSDELYDDSQAVQVELLARTFFIKSKKVMKIAALVDRKNYIHKTPYSPYCVDVGYGATFSRLHVQTLVLETLEDYLQEGNRVLDVGCGTGYLTVCMALMVGSSGRVIGIEHIPQLIKNATKYVWKDDPILLDEDRVKFIEGDGRLGVPDEGPYDAIHIGASIDTVPPALLQQLKKGGRLVAISFVNYNVFGEPRYGLRIYDKLKNGTTLKGLRMGWVFDKKIEVLGDKDKQLANK